METPTFLVKNNENASIFEKSGNWNAFWLSNPDFLQENPIVSLFKNDFYIDSYVEIKMYISADERYSLYLDEKLIGKGSERGDALNWFYESYVLKLDKGQHSLKALVSSHANLKPWAQISVMHGFILEPDKPQYDSILATGLSNWMVATMKNYEFVDISKYGIGTGARVNISLTNKTNKFVNPIKIKKGRSENNFSISTSDRILKSAILPHMMYEFFFEQEFIFENCENEIKFELDNYYCFYPEMTIEGKTGDEICLKSAEEENEIFIGDCYKICENGTFEVSPLWWLAGRFIKISAKTSDKLRVKIKLFETRYPSKTAFKPQDKRFSKLFEMAIRSLEVCNHETYMDCPFYEQLMYVGDTRLQILCSYVLYDDVRPAKKALLMLSKSADNFSGFPACAYPCDSFRIIPSFSLIYVCMLYDFAIYAKDKEFLQSIVKTARNILNYFPQNTLVKTPEGWNYFDAVPIWKFYEPPCEENGVCAIFNMTLVMAFEKMAFIEDFLGENLFSQTYSQKAENLMQLLINNYYVKEKSLFADDMKKDKYSVHLQALAQCCNCLPQSLKKENFNALIETQNLTKTNIYFSFYLYECYLTNDRFDLIEKSMLKLTEKLDMKAKTLPEGLEYGVRSKCHGWGAYVVYYYIKKFGFTS